VSAVLTRTKLFLFVEVITTLLVLLLWSLHCQTHSILPLDLSPRSTKANPSYIYSLTFKIFLGVLVLPIPRLWRLERREPLAAAKSTILRLFGVSRRASVWSWPMVRKFIIPVAATASLTLAGPCEATTCSRLWLTRPRPCPRLLDSASTISLSTVKAFLPFPRYIGSEWHRMTRGDRDRPRVRSTCRNVVVASSPTPTIRFRCRSVRHRSVQGAITLLILSLLAIRMK
jgi:hypothetical protein